MAGFDSSYLSLTQPPILTVERQDRRQVPCWRAATRIACLELLALREGKGALRTNPRPFSRQGKRVCLREGWREPLRSDRQQTSSRERGGVRPRGARGDATTHGGACRESPMGRSPGARDRNSVRLGAARPSRWSWGRPGGQWSGARLAELRTCQGELPARGAKHRPAAVSRALRLLGPPHRCHRRHHHGGIGSAGGAPGPLATERIRRPRWGGNRVGYAGNPCD